MIGRRRSVAAVATMVLALSGCSGSAPTSATKDTKQLEVVSWWTSGSEAAALDTLLTAFRQTNPDVHTVNAAVAGGGGSQAIVELAKRLQKNDPPDVWQTFAGESVQGYADRNAIRDVSSVFTDDDLRTVMHPTVLQSLMHDGKP